MTYTRDPRSYPPAFITLMQVGSVRRVEIPCADQKDAKRLEGRIHAFVGVLHKSGVKDPEMKILSDQARRVQIKAVNGVLVALPRDLEPDNQLILSALGRAPSSGAGDESVPMSAEMREMFNKGLTTPGSAL